MNRFLLILILLIAVLFRFNNFNWDSNAHLHPDERFLTMVGTEARIPVNLLDYFNPQVSTLNPNNVGFKFFVYGVLPVTLNKILAVMFDNDNYNLFTFQGRFLSAFFDLLVVILVFKTIFIFEKKFNLDKGLKYWAAFFYAIAVLPVQLSHFFTVDTFLNFFMFASFYFAIRSCVGNRPAYAVASAGKHACSLRDIVFSAIFFGLAVASKITAVFILPLNLFFILYGTVLNRSLRKLFQYLFIFGLIAYTTLRLADPYIFKNANFFDLQANPVFIENLKSLSSMEHKDVWYPPAVQWMNKPEIIFSLVNIAFFGLGLPYFILVVVGIYSMFFYKKFQTSLASLRWRSGNFKFKIIILWLVVFFIYQSSQFAQTMRYFIFLYPFFSILAAFGVNRLLSVIARSKATKQSQSLEKAIASPRILGARNDKLNPNIFYVIFYILIISILLIWPLMFSSIYTNKNSRVEASEWIINNIPDKSVIISEHWDDALPVSLNTPSKKQFTVYELPVFDPDNDLKWQKINALLKIGNYYILSSNRGWGSIPTVPERYPRMTKFYNDLLAGKLNYKKIKEFTSYPSIQFRISKFEFRILFPDDWSDESFTVYDHPKVMIFKKQT